MFKIAVIKVVPPAAVLRQIGLPTCMPAQPGGWPTIVMWLLKPVYEHLDCHFARFAFH